ncbi:MAG: CPBP family intramembrane metalloprotease [Deltaproteobacteria bacterium]|nr:MAG: CPBP family intramembrane metalloprotease [Deltaproteobacteria bacterium]TMQ04782.1 MAG: CPBP family intramembrane metalloprotease [Deltaproteobacteria bacterium]
MMTRSPCTGRGDVAASLVLIFPLLLAYEIGVLFAGRVNGADLVTRAVFAVAGSRAAYLAIYAVVAVGFLIWIRHTRRWGTLRLALAGPVVLEAALYALTLGALVSLIVDRLLGLGLGVPAVISALGAGVHEELVFRLALIAGLYALARPLGRSAAVAVAIAVSSLLFAAAHHLGAHGEPWTVHAFAFRAVAGGVFGAIFWFRSLAHAVYAHVLYDLLVAAA